MHPGRASGAALLGYAIGTDGLDLLVMDTRQLGDLTVDSSAAVFSAFLGLEGLNELLEGFSFGSSRVLRSGACGRLAAGQTGPSEDSGIRRISVKSFKVSRGELAWQDVIDRLFSPSPFCSLLMAHCSSTHLPAP